MGAAFSQLFPPKPELTEKELGDLQGKVYIVTGSNTGVGKQLAQILYAKHATVYAAARSQEKALQAIESIRAAHPTSTGKLTYLHLDLSDLPTVKAAADTFLSQETQLHVLFNNAAVALTPAGSKTAQDHELQMGTNCLGHFLFTRLLTPTIASTAKTSPPDSVRVVWVSSSAAEALSHKPGGIPLDHLDTLLTSKFSPWKLYGISKAGNYLHATEYARRYSSDGIVSVSLNPGNLDSDLGRHAPKIVNWFFKKLLLYPPVFGAYTELYAGLSPAVKTSTVDMGKWIIPWGRIGTIRKDLVDASKPEGDEGGTGAAAKFWEWSEKQVSEYV